jgi:hypothetical protein
VTKTQLELFTVDTRMVIYEKISKKIKNMKKGREEAY